MEFPEGSFKVMFITIGRKSGKEHSVELRAVFYKEKIYFSRRDTNSDWLKNSVQNQHVKIQYLGKFFTGIASLVNDQELCKKISQLKYSDKRSQDSRIVLEVTLCE